MFKHICSLSERPSIAYTRYAYYYTIDNKKGVDILVGLQAKEIENAA